MNFKIIIELRKEINNMSLGENLQFLRKRDNITQEQLAEKLEVSRQSVSKWESDTTYPEMDKLLQICQMFHCSVDDMLQKDVSNLYLEDKTNYDSHMNFFSKIISFSVALILLGVASMLFIEGLQIREGLSAVILFIFIVVAVAIIIVVSIQHSDFEKKNPFIENFYTTEEVDTFNKKFSIMIAFGVATILIGIIVLIGAVVIFPEIDGNEPLESILTSVFLLFITVAAAVLVYAGMQKGKYNIDEYNKMHNKDSEEYKQDELVGRICGCIMMIATIIYLICGFVFNMWGVPAIVVFPVGGIGCGIASIIVRSRNRN